MRDVMNHEELLTVKAKFIFSVLLLLTHGEVFAHNPAKSMLVFSGLLLIPGAIAATIAEERKIWWFLASIPLIVMSVWLAFSAVKINPYIYLSIPFLLIPLSFFQNRRPKATQKSENEGAS